MPKEFWQCDRCGELVEKRVPAGPNTQYTLQLNPIGRDPITGGPARIEGSWTLCPSCYQAFRNFLATVVVARRE
jgi:hypothetical protein